MARVDAGSPAESAGLKAGDAVEAVDGTGVSAAQFDDRVRQKRPGDLVALRIASAGAAPRLVNVPVQRRACRAPVFDPTYYGNLALAYMRFGDYRQALDQLTALGNVVEGFGVGKGAVMFFRARCLEAMGERDRALALYKDVSGLDDQPFADDGAGVATLARRRLAALARTP